MKSCIDFLPYGAVLSFQNGAPMKFKLVFFNDTSGNRTRFPLFHKLCLYNDKGFSINTIYFKCYELTESLLNE